jgi:hypothetical protein
MKMLTTEKQIVEQIERIKETVASTSIILFRGENQKYPKISSTKARSNTFY